LVNHRYYPLLKEENYNPAVCVESFFSEEEMVRLNMQLETVSVSAAIVGSHNIKDDKHFEELRLSSLSIRKSNVSFLDFSSWGWLYDKLSQAVMHVNSTNYNKMLYGIEALQYSEYDSSYSGFYGPHIDDTVVYSGLRRSLSFSLQLSNPESYTGGTLAIYNNNTTYESNKAYGSITFFDSGMMHEVLPVTSGFRKSLVGWVLGPRV
jgi:PKHD-type hydroxylase